MIFPLREIDVMGVFISPFALCLPIAFVATLGALAIVHRTRGVALLARSPAMELAVFIGLLSGLVLLLGRI
ncbi:DUF1656 domain-containing protein [Methylocella silvestris]|uniref:DUF1656 domain-containing protein n=1 Tax=Methylocella silvestris TaxID=199596 RepID=A0A2J7TCE3_METSI|nr:DUF1656 domain-containing protein [Methylocella silvestris]PNG24437.1 hypothetical protein CR492_18620 [Methylocella silvestris]